MKSAFDVRGSGTVTLNFENVTQEELRRFHELIQELFLEGIFTMRSGKVILHFDINGVLQRIDWDLIKWRRDKAPLPLDDPQKSVSIKAVTLTHNNEQVPK